MHRWAIVCVLILATMPLLAQENGNMEGIFNVKHYGAKADGVTDDTAAIQKTLDEAKESGGTVYLPPGKYLVKGSLNIHAGVSLEGCGKAPRYNNPLTGTVILATCGRDDENAPALFELHSSTSVSGITVYYPEQKVTDIHPYSWTFHLQGEDNTIENVTLINSYNGIRIGPGLTFVTVLGVSTDVSYVEVFLLMLAQTLAE